eukprot:TRINITY_DN6031_c0_g1_i1.p1 TRINITY_DN6031_c0_g1~~TRINITY_DN6031_c0_g1_i1.p1  ORF type:complete len:322 (+),score=104.50 TRINITY_DN6031_c0_g1_i1:77-1042(+)
MDLFTIFLWAPFLSFVIYLIYVFYPRTMDIPAAGKVILVTGGASGIGLAVVKKLVEMKCQVVACDVNGRGLKELQEKYPQIKTYLVDVTQKDEVEELHRQLEEHNYHVWGIANIAGIWNAPNQKPKEMKSVIELEDDELSSVLNVNLLGAMKVNRTFFPMIKETKGCILQVTSTAGRVSVVGTNSAYCISKRALMTYMDFLRREISHLGIRVLCVEPGATVTPLSMETFKDMTTYQYDKTQFSGMFRDTTSVMHSVGFDNPKNWQSPEHVADVIVHQMFTSTNPIPHLVIDHPIIKFGVIATSFLPYAIQDVMLKGRKWSR